MSTHIPADYFTKPILADLGVGKVPGCNGWIKRHPYLRRITKAEVPGERGEWVTPVHWDHDGIDGASRAFCGCEAPSIGRWVRVEGPQPEPGSQPAPPYTTEQRETGKAYWFAGPFGDRLEAWFHGERTQGYVRRESEVERWARVAVLFRSLTGEEPPRDISTVSAVGFGVRMAKHWPLWVKWTAEHEEQLRPRWSLHLRGRVNEAGELLPDMGLIDCAKCLAAWDRFSEHTGAQVVLASMPTDDYDESDHAAEALHGAGSRW